MSTSGAEIFVTKVAYNDAKVAKRLNEQAYWLTTHDDRGLVKVGAIKSFGYEMELLSPPRYPVRVDAITTILERAVWNRPPTASWDLGRSIDYFENMEHGLELWDWLIGFKNELGECDTHGDPTFENVLVRDDQLVLVDPIPADGRLPSVRALDLGKIGQSLIGYEGVKAGKFNAYDPDRVHGLRRYCVDEEEFRATLCFTAIHVARLIPYQQPKQTSFWREQLPDIIAAFERV